MSVAGSLPMMPDENNILPTLAPIGIGALPWLTPSTSMERGRRLGLDGLLSELGADVD